MSQPPCASARAPAQDAAKPGWAIGYNAIALPIAAGVFEPAFGLVLRPEIAALSMSGSSLLVAVNALTAGTVPLPEPPVEADTVPATPARPTAPYVRCRSKGENGFGGDAATAVVSGASASAPLHPALSRSGVFLGFLGLDLGEAWLVEPRGLNGIIFRGSAFPSIVLTVQVERFGGRIVPGVQNQSPHRPRHLLRCAGAGVRSTGEAWPPSDHDPDGIETAAASCEFNGLRHQSVQ